MQKMNYPYYSSNTFDTDLMHRCLILLYLGTRKVLNFFKTNKGEKRLQCAIPDWDGWPPPSQISFKEEAFHGNK